jgi:hypothetical protein
VPVANNRAKIMGRVDERRMRDLFVGWWLEGLDRAAHMGILQGIYNGTSSQVKRPLPSSEQVLGPQQRPITAAGDPVQLPMRSLTNAVSS